MTTVNPDPKFIRHQDPEEKFTIKMKATPLILMDSELFDKLMYFVRNGVPNECQWYSLIDRKTGLDDPDSKLVYCVSDLFIPAQLVAPREVDTFDGNSMSEMWRDIRSNRSLTAAEISNLMTRGRLWGHSHVNMPPKPSGEDDKQWEFMKEASQRDKTKNPIGMIILNCQEKYTTRIYDPELNAEFHNASLITRDLRDFSYIDEALATRLFKKPEPVKPVTTSVVSGYQNSVSHPGSTNTSSSSSFHQYDKTKEQGVTIDFRTENSTQATVKVTQPTSASKSVTRPVKDTLYIRQLLPVGVIGTISKPLLALDTLVEKIGIDNKISTRLVMKIDDINRCSSKQIDKIKHHVDNALTILESLPKETQLTAIKDTTVAIKLLEVIFDNIERDDGDVLQLTLDGLIGLVHTKAAMVGYFERELIECEQLFVYAIAVAKLLRMPGEEGAKQALGDRYIEHLITVSKAVNKETAERQA